VGKSTGFIANNIMFYNLYMAEIHAGIRCKTTTMIINTGIMYLGVFKNIIGL
jgi:hypothetical protein